MKNKKTDDPPFSSSKKLCPPPLSAHQKVMTHPHILPAPPPVEIMNGPLDSCRPIMQIQMIKYFVWNKNSSTLKDQLIEIWYIS